MNVRAVLLSLVVGVMTVVLLVLYLRRLEVETSGGSPIGVIAVIKPIEPGTTITADMLSIKVVPQAYVESRAVLKNDLAKIVGLKVDTLLKAQQTLMWTDLAIASDDRRQLSNLVQPGMRAVGIRASHDDKHLALIRPGDRVDVYANVPPNNGNANDKERISVVVVQNVIVLAVGLDTGAREIAGARQQAASRDEQVLTISVNPQQLQLIGLAGERGKLTVGVRNPTDTRLLEGIADLSSSALAGPEKEKKLAVATSTKPLHLKADMGPSTAPIPKNWSDP